MNDRTLLTGLAVTVLGFLLQLGFGELGINVDLNPLDDMELTLFETLEIIGLGLIAYARRISEPLRAKRTNG